MILLAAATKPDLIAFGISALIIMVGAFGVVLSRHPVHSALMLVLTLFGVAVAFVAQRADFLAAVQVIVYAGAIVILFLFVIMLIGVDNTEDLKTEPLKLQRPFALVLGLVLLGEVALLGRSDWATGAESTLSPLNNGKNNIRSTAEQLFTRDLLAFEITSALLVIAVVGAVVLARRNQGMADDVAETDEAGAPFAEEVSA